MGRSLVVTRIALFHFSFIRNFMQTVRVQRWSSPLHVSECFSRGTSSTVSTPTTGATVRPSRMHRRTSRRRDPLRATATALRYEQAIIVADVTKASSGPVLTSAGRDAWTSRRLVRHRSLPRRRGRTCGGGGSFRYQALGPASAATQRRLRVAHVQRSDVAWYTRSWQLYRYLSLSKFRDVYLRTLSKILVE
jgi:hypothetical protein